jgi:hypothetical protein
MINLLLGDKRPSRSVGGTQNRGSEFGPSIQPSFIVELSVKDGKLSAALLKIHGIG